jgi:hypothetical protein
MPTRYIAFRAAVLSVRIAVAVFLLSAGSWSLQASKIPDFKGAVLPLFIEHCGKCHSGETPESGFQVSSHELLLQGGDSGPAVVAGSSARSLLYERVRDRQMPPEEPLRQEQIDLIRSWIDAGALGGDEPHGVKHGSAASLGAAEVMTRVFFTHCISCHGKLKQESGLDLRSVEGMLRGGKSGPAIVPGNPESSLVYRRLVADEMPPRTSVLGDSNYVRRVSPDELELVRAWIAGGAPALPPLALESGAKVKHVDFWSFRPRRQTPVPEVTHIEDVRTPIDAFILQKLESRNLRLSQPASKLRLLRRAYFDLFGLPPSAEESAQFMADNRDKAYEELIDRLLKSPRYGERWAQHWLDAVGYADSHGKIDRDQFRPYMWRYRDYVIRALNADKPYDQFLAEQIAGDELIQGEKTGGQAGEIEALIATSFLLTATDATDEAAFNFIPNRFGVLAEQIDIFSTAVMGLTMECARCHNHKFDPISQNDYYRFSAILQSSLDPYDWRISSHVYHPGKQPLAQVYQRYIYHPADREPEELGRFNDPLRAQAVALEEKIAHKIDEARQRLAAAGETDAKTLSVETLAAKDPGFKRELDALRAENSATLSRIIQPGVIAGVRDLGGEPTPVFLLRRGDPSAPALRVRPGVPRFLETIAGEYRPAPLPPETNTSGNRLGLARWLTGPEHPLTARVIVNRIWQHHFGQGIVSTPGNFGAKGAQPTHPELLDWLACELVENGWSLKHLHRLIMTSSVYRQNSEIGSDQLREDPENNCLSRFPMRRLDGESIRDSILLVSGRLDETPFGPPDGVLRTAEGEVIPAGSTDKQRRSIYLAKMRMRPLTLVEQFDGPDMVPNCLARSQSTVTTQALQLYNSQFVRDSARSFARRVMECSTVSKRQQIEKIYWTAFGRPPASDEMQHAIQDLARLEAAWETELTSRTGPETNTADAAARALEVYCHAILNSPEFVYID